MDNKPEQTTAPSALDKVAAALTELGQETAAAIAKRAGVGYSTATKKLRVLEEAGQAEPCRADDGGTRWRQVASTASSTGSDNTSTSTSDADPIDAAAPNIGEDECPRRPDEPSTPAENVTGPDEPTAARPDDADPASSDDNVERPTPHGPPGRPDNSPTGPVPVAEVEEERDEPDCTGNISDSVVATVDETDAGQTSTSTIDRDPAEDPHASTDGKSRRSKGTLRGAVLDVLEAHPDQPFKTGQLCGAIDKANEGSGSAKASAGAVVNAVHKLIADNLAIQVVERPATFQLAPKGD